LREEAGVPFGLVGVGSEGGFFPFPAFFILVNLIRQGKTVLYVTHDLDLAKKATAGIMLRDGRIVNAFNANAVIAAPPAPTPYYPDAQGQGGLK